jgi:uncharacterized membrane protein
VDATDLLLVAMRWLHSLAAVVWIGSVIHELLFTPTLADGTRADALAGATAKEIVETSLVVFLVTGAILTFERLSRGAAGASYVAVLGIKILLAVAMFQLAFRFRRATGRARALGLRWLSGLGVAILLLAALLKAIYERALLP